MGKKRTGTRSTAVNQRALEESMRFRERKQRCQQILSDNKFAKAMIREEIAHARESWQIWHAKAIPYIHPVHRAPHIHTVGRLQTHTRYKV